MRLRRMQGTPDLRTEVNWVHPVRAGSAPVAPPRMTLMRNTGGDRVRLEIDLPSGPQAVQLLSCADGRHRLPGSSSGVTGASSWETPDCGRSLHLPRHL